MWCLENVSKTYKDDKVLKFYSNISEISPKIEWSEVLILNCKNL